LPAADRSNIGRRRGIRTQPGAGVERPPFALPDEKHESPDVLRYSGVAGHGIVEAFEPDEDVDIWLRHRARLPNSRGPDPAGSVIQPHLAEIGSAYRSIE
jgi:hypothetical protein